MSYKVVGYTRIWRDWIKYPVYIVGFSFLMGWIIMQNYSVIHMQQYLDVVIIAWLTMTVACMCWLIGMAGIIIEWKERMEKDERRD